MIAAVSSQSWGWLFQCWGPPSLCISTAVVTSANVCPAVGFAVGCSMITCAYTVPSSQFALRHDWPFHLWICPSSDFSRNTFEPSPLHTVATSDHPHNCGFTSTWRDFSSLAPLLYI